MTPFSHKLNDCLIFYFFFFFKCSCGKAESRTLRFSQSLSSKSLFLKSPNNVKPLKPEPGHISVRPGVQRIAAEYGSPGEARKPSQKPPARSPLHALHLPQQLVIVAVVGRLELWDWRTIRRYGDTGGFIVTRSIIRPMIITDSINFRLQRGCPTSLAVTSFLSKHTLLLAAQGAFNTPLNWFNIFCRETTTTKDSRIHFSTILLLLSSPLAPESVLDKIISYNLYPSVLGLK